MRTRISKAMIGLCALMMMTDHASAQSRNCGQHEKITDHLASKYGESRQVIAMNADNSVLEVFASIETGTWTITITKADGVTCIVAAGQHYQYLAEAAVVDDSGA